MIGRSFIKALSWRLVATSTTVTIAWIMTGTMKLALTLGAAEFAAKILIYMGHEHAWDLILKNSDRN